MLMSSKKGFQLPETNNPNATPSVQRRAMSKKGSKEKPAEFMGFCNASLAEEDRGEWVQWTTEPDLFDQAFNEACELGFKFTTNFDIKDDCFRSTAACWIAGLPSAGRILTVRGAHPTTSLSRVVWLLVHKLHYDLGEGEPPTRDPDAW